MTLSATPRSSRAFLSAAELLASLPLPDPTWFLRTSGKDGSRTIHGVDHVRRVTAHAVWSWRFSSSPSTTRMTSRASGPRVGSPARPPGSACSRCSRMPTRSTGSASGRTTWRPDSYGWQSLAAGSLGPGNCSRPPAQTTAWRGQLPVRCGAPAPAPSPAAYRTWGGQEAGRRGPGAACAQPAPPPPCTPQREITAPPSQAHVSCHGARLALVRASQRV